MVEVEVGWVKKRAKDGLIRVEQNGLLPKQYKHVVGSKCNHNVCMLRLGGWTNLFPLFMAFSHPPSPTHDIDFDV